MNCPDLETATRLGAGSDPQRTDGSIVGRKRRSAGRTLSRYWPSTNTPPGNLAILSLNRFNFLAQPLEDEVAALIKIGQYYDLSFNNL